MIIVLFSRWIEAGTFPPYLLYNDPNDDLIADDDCPSEREVRRRGPAWCSAGCGWPVS